MEINIENMRIGTEENFYSYEEFNNLLGDTIEFLKGKGFKSDSKIPIWCHDNLNIIALTLAAISMNACAVLIDAQKKEKEVLDILRMISELRIISDIEKAELQEMEIFEYSIYSIKNRKYNQNMYPVFRTEDEDKDAVIIFTSGSTGTPKGVVRTQKKVMTHMKTMIKTLQITSEDKILHLAPLCHAYGFEHIMAGIYGGGTNTLYNLFAYREILDQMKKQASVVIGVPYQYELLTRMNCTFSSNKLRLLLCATSSLKYRTYNTVMKSWKLPITQLYGSSELSAALVNMEGKNATSVGKTILGVKARINTEGELLIQSSYICERYIGDKYELPVEDGWYHTGDMAIFDQYGGIIIKGRLDSIINVSGKKVCPEEVEKVLISMPGIREAIVYGKTHETYGNIIAAKFVGESQITESEIKKFCGKYLADYEIPMVIEKVDNILHTTTGKISRKEFS